MSQQIYRIIKYPERLNFVLLYFILNKEFIFVTSIVILSVEYKLCLNQKEIVALKPFKYLIKTI